MGFPMPWKEICNMELREKLVSAILVKDTSVAEMCRRHAVYHKTASSWPIVTLPV
jgi:hypothetical protein